MSYNTGAESTIVVVDDEEDSFWLMKHLFKRIGAKEKIVWLSDGEQALTHLLAEAQNGRALPILMILDLNMPKLHGFDVLRILKDSPEFSQLLVVVVSSSSLPEDIARSLQLGAFCYFEKYPLPEKFAPIYEIAKSRLPAAANTTDPCEIALRNIIALVERAVSAAHKPNTAIAEQDEQVLGLLGGIRRRATGKLLERINSPIGARERWPFEPGSDATVAS